MNVKLNAERVLTIATARGIAGISGIATRLGVHRSTVSRWLSSSAPALPGTAAQAVALAALLDIDPLTLFDAPAQDFGKLCVRLHRAARTGDWEQLHPVFEFAGSYCTPSDDWPPEIASKFFRRDWHIRDFAVSPSDVGVGYATLEVAARSLDAANLAEPDDASPPPKAWQPRVWHIAFRDTASVVPQPWRPHGALIFTNGRLHIASLRGFVMIDASDRRSDTSVRAQVQVWVGAHSGVLRVASLHPFQARWHPKHGHTREPLQGAGGPGNFRFCEQGFRCHGPGEDEACPYATRCGGFHPEATLTE
ncbi:MAG: hypothetical protein IV100_21780 [Myxococcales bacterium]|nr:hypothetical protein [Myxococcales bacterium]